MGARSDVSPAFLRRPGAAARVRLWLIVCVFAVACATRLFNSHAIEPFIDEGLHLYGAAHFDFEPILARIALGKVLGYLIFYPTAQWSSDPLGATRMLVGLLGVGSTFGLFLFIEQLAGMASAAFAAFFWAVFPLVTFHDRLALHDPIASLFVIWSAYLAVRAALQGKTWMAALGGSLLGLAAVTKLNSVLSIVWCVPLLVLLNKKGRLFDTRLFAYAVGLALPLLVFLTLLWSKYSGGGFIGRVSVSGGGSQFWAVAISNVRLAWAWATHYGSPWLAPLVVVCVVNTILRPTAIKKLLLGSWLFLGIFSIVGSRVLFSRYLLPFVVPFAGWLALGVTSVLGYLRDRSRPRRALGVLGVIALVACFGHWIGMNLELQRDPLHADLPEDDRFQYLLGWPSGTGSRACAEFLREYRGRVGEDIVVITGGPGSQGMMALPHELRSASGIALRPRWVATRDQVAATIAGAAREHTLVLMEPPYYQWPKAAFAAVAPVPDLLWNYHRPHSSHGFRLYRLSRMSALSSDGSSSSLPGYWERR